MSTDLMEYIPTQGGAPQQAPQSGARKFHGAIAQGYDKKREDSPKWKIEQAIIVDMLSDLPFGTWVLDAPVGTGRFFDTYHELGHIVRAVDISVDMLAEADRKVKDKSSIIHGHRQFAFAKADVCHIGLQDNFVDVAVCCRLTRWLIQDKGPDGIVRWLQEMQRMARQRVIFTARVRNHPWAVSYDLIKSALNGWHIHRDETGVDMDYRIIELRPDKADKGVALC